MGTLKEKVLDLWNYALETYRTMVIKAELRRRRAIKNIEDRKSALRTNSGLLRDHNPSQPHKDGHVIIVKDVQPPAAAAAPAATASKTLNCSCRSEMSRVFDLFDENKDGLICGKELKLYMKRLGFELSDQNVKDMLETVDSNRDGCVDFEEFCSMYSFLCANVGGSSGTEDPPNAKEDEVEEDLLKAFFVFDTNKDGLISVLELQQVLLNLGVKEGKSLMSCQKMIERVDADGDGNVDFFEFKDMMCSDALSLCRS